MLRSTAPARLPEHRQDLPDQALLVSTQDFPGGDQIGELALPSRIGRDKARLQSERGNCGWPAAGQGRPGHV
ncbi:hypothetical protein [Microvirga sp. VF16]|uniref:hypothetical protein n=1 Tax=Microvirga sp. VF16 TaxID=2807101 RepID=UPI00193CA756|nr:hypothetical protein [Microvirga sp. VF16]